MQNEVKASARLLRISAQKARLVADLIRGKPVNKAMNILEFTPKKAAQMIHNVLKSAVANAENNCNMEADDLFVSTIYIDRGSYFKRLSARAKGRGMRIMKPTCNIYIAVCQEIKKG